MSLPIDPKQVDESRFWEKVSVPIDPDACWEWQGAMRSKGYGAFKLSGRIVLPHRVSYALEHGAVSPDLFVCHRCDNPPCVNPSHLFLGTRSENMLDCVAKGRWERPWKEGEDCPSSVLTDEKVREIRRLRAAGRTLMSLAEQFGVGYSTVRDAATNLQWTHV